jgi:hypothetical protein
MNRRDFLRMGRSDPAPGAGPSAARLEISCEGLYMRYVDARSAGDAAEPFRWLEGRLHGVGALRLADREWLAGDDLEQRLAPVLASFRARGGRVEPG